MSFMPVFCANISTTRCVELPLPADAKFSDSGSALARAASSSNERIPVCVPATSRKGVFTKRLTPSKSRAG
ncbi:hypothetical protein D9M68_876830 [compost metagenome]